jgi:glycosyltransferase involved in cell wall biosynthesis
VNKLEEQLGVVFHHLPFHQKGQNPIRDTITIYLLYKAYKRIAPDAILHFTVKPNLYGSISSRLLNIPTINNVTGLGTVFLHNTIGTRLARVLYKAIFPGIQKVVFQNRDDLSLFVEEKIIKKENAALVRGSGVDTKSLIPSYQPKQSPLRILFIGRLLYDKGIVELLDCVQEALIQKKNWTFKVVGKGENEAGLGLTESELLERSENLSNFEYIGFTSEIFKIIEQADLVILPSHREGFPKSLLEAAGIGKVLLASDVPGCREIVQNGENGLLFEVKNSESIFEAIEAIEQLPDAAYYEMQRKSREIAELSSFEAIQDFYSVLLREIL